ncbi:MAG: hypothetical protein FJ189_04000 [Gammaproteobacteria bacterium]|nr:hypothetical protein [Gammaproteobacteria bacterium]
MSAFAGVARTVAASVARYGQSATYVSASGARTTLSVLPTGSAALSREETDQGEYQVQRRSVYVLAADIPSIDTRDAVLLFDGESWVSWIVTGGQSDGAAGHVVSLERRELINRRRL